MAITKSNKHKLSLDYDKPNEKGECKLATLYALMRSLILDSQISITTLGSCSPLHSKMFSQLNKWARELNWMSRRCIYTPPFKTWLLLSNSAHLRSDRTCSSRWPDAPVSGQWPQTRQLSNLTVRVTGHRAEFGPSWPDASDPQISSLNPYWCWPDASSLESGHLPVGVQSLVNSESMLLQLRSSAHPV
jgi:hypothetical protein